MCETPSGAPSRIGTAAMRHEPFRAEEMLCCRRLNRNAQAGRTPKPDPPDQLRINTVRFLSVDAVQKANSGHPGRGSWKPDVTLEAIG